MVLRVWSTARLPITRISGTAMVVGDWLMGVGGGVWGGVTGDMKFEVEVVGGGCLCIKWYHKP